MDLKANKAKNKTRAYKVVTRGAKKKASAKLIPIRKKPLS